MSATDHDELLFQIRLNGFCVVPGVIPADRCGEIRDSIIETVEREYHKSAVGESAAERKVGFTPSIINHDQSFAEYLADERLLTFVRRMLGDHVRISFTSAIINQPGNERGEWHADWPFNQKNAGRMPAPYPDVVVHLTTLWMLSPFETDNGGTLLLPGSHRCPTNPTAGDVAQSMQPPYSHSTDGAFTSAAALRVPGPTDSFAAEINAAGDAGSVLVMDSRLWHATAPNRSDQPRVALAVRYAPWWLNLEVLRPGSDERKRMCDEVGASDNLVPSIDPDVFDGLPENVRPLYRHWVGEP